MLVSLPFCGSPKPQGCKGFVFPSPQPQPVAGCEVLHGCGAWDSQHQLVWGAASGSWLCMQEKWRLLTADPLGKITIDCPPLPLP